MTEDRLKGRCGIDGLSVGPLCMRGFTVCRGLRTASLLGKFFALIILIVNDSLIFNIVKFFIRNRFGDFSQIITHPFDLFYLFA